MPRDKSRYRDKRSSSYSSESSYDRKRSKSKHKRRSRSKNRDKAESRSKRKRSSSRSKHKKRSYSRSVSRDRYESKSKRRSSSRSRSKRSNRNSRDNSRSSSRSRSKKYSKSKKSQRRSRSSSSHSSSFDIERPLPYKQINMDDIESKVEKSIKAAAAAGLTMSKIPTYEYKEVEIKEEMPTIHDRNLLAEINNDSFAPKAFTSSKNKKHQNIVIDLDTDTVKLPSTELKVQKDDSILDFSAIPSEEVLKEMWIKKLYQYRKKMLKEEQ